ncbi:GCV3 [[Candida] subhashii]|uniref:Glycine cleavage system H protein n=1 Tax=[Candida] subhashii TaxID=561895 RepID=A0A8J5QIJ3_9ASCO|nr:GCV3 [[Candida] subhashii]KAG7661796.1 GCV3 [[Candida] subhashii]
MFKSLLRTSIVRPTFVSPIATRAAFFSTSRFALNGSQKVNPKADIFKYHQSEGPAAVRYTPDHEWVAIMPDYTAYVGITRYAAEALGDVTFVELPEIGDPVEIGDSIGSIESVKSASEIYSPVKGEIIAINNAASGDPSIVNTDPLGEGWITQIKLDTSVNVDEANDSLMTEEEYVASIQES